MVASTSESSSDADRLDGVDRPAAGEDREPREERLLGAGEQTVAPVERGAERLLALRQVAGAFGEQLERRCRAGEQSRPARAAGPGGGELDRERQPVEPAADLGHGARTIRR